MTTREQERLSTVTAEHRAHFDAFGFLVVRQLLSPAETVAITAAFDQALAAARRGEAFDGEKRQLALGFVEHTPGLRWLLEDDRIFTTVEALLGPGFTWLGSDGNLYVGDTQWHPDAREPTWDTLKVAFYLDPVGKEAGALRVVPGSHRLPLHEALQPLRRYRDEPEARPFGVAPRDVPSVALESAPGDVVFFNRSIWHASFGGHAGRRMFTHTYVAAPTTEAHLAYLRRVYQGKCESLRRLSYTQPETVYGEAILASDRPRLRAMTAKLVELGFK
jgi:ectoine hydroxylase-related dioxygenase (phytanoyl-CoA dioxygenase family)